MPPSLEPMEDDEERKALKPVGDHTLAADLLLRLYGFHAIPSSIKPLDSYDDLNFYVEALVPDEVSSERPALRNRQDASSPDQYVL